MRIGITASGGGHTGYAVALAQRIYGKAEIVFYIPTGDEWSRSKVYRYGDVIEIRKARGPNEGFQKLLTGIPKAFFESIDKVKNIDVFVSTGSNHSVPPALVAKFKRVPVINIESSVRFTRPSSSAKYLSYISDLTVLQWEEQKKILPRGRFFGPLYERPEYEIRDEGYILVTAGTYGFKELFDAIVKTGLDNIVLQTGRVDPRPYKETKKNWVIFDFDPEINRWIARASLVITHLGKTVIDAALTYKKPTVVIPNPNWRLTAGYEDAKILAEKLGVCYQESLDPWKLLEIIEKCRGVKPREYRDGAEELAREILKRFS
ncbi:MAG: UDP-N-acetylglucosamine--N-acetylmuramyl-(pentapeptide) pyrophosphoryl-undecaprenol N-acetylglucosamine transferase [Sulfolobales archaeon]